MGVFGKSFNQILAAFVSSNKDGDVKVDDLSAIFEQFGTTPNRFLGELARRGDS